MSRPVPLHREVHPHLDADGCYACRVSRVRVDTRMVRIDRELGETQAERLREIRNTAAAEGREVQSKTRWV